VTCWDGESGVTSVCARGDDVGGFHRWSEVVEDVIDRGRSVQKLGKGDAWCFAEEILWIGRSCLLYQFKTIQWVVIYDSDTAWLRCVGWGWLRPGPGVGGWSVTMKQTPFGAISVSTDQAFWRSLE